MLNCTYNKLHKPKESILVRHTMILIDIGSVGRGNTACFMFDYQTGGRCRGYATRVRAFILTAGGSSKFD